LKGVVVEFSKFKEALSAYSSEALVVQLHDGASAIWWNVDISHPHERLSELHLWLEALATEGLLPGYSQQPSTWLSQNVRTVEQVSRSLSIIRDPTFTGERAAPYEKLVSIFRDITLPELPQDETIMTPRM
jgi:hypothetical protein